MKLLKKEFPEGRKQIGKIHDGQITTNRQDIIKVVKKFDIEVNRKI